MQNAFEDSAKRDEMLSILKSSSENEWATEETFANRGKACMESNKHASYYFEREQMK